MRPNRGELFTGTTNKIFSEFRVKLSMVIRLLGSRKRFN